jgi:hypothetical protein
MTALRSPAAPKKGCRFTPRHARILSSILRGVNTEDLAGQTDFLLSLRRYVHWAESECLINALTPVSSQIGCLEKILDKSLPANGEFR